MSKVTTFNHDGMVGTGYSLPYVAEYNADGQGGITYEHGAKMARGVNVTITPTVQDTNNFSADNGLAEEQPPVVTGGTAVFTVDGLLPTMREFLTGMTAKAEGAKFQYIGDNAVANRPDIGIAYVGRFMCGGQTLYTPMGLVRAKFTDSESTLATQEYGQPISWQTRALNFSFKLGEDDNHSWKIEGDFYTTEAEAEADIKNLFGIQ